MNILDLFFTPVLAQTDGGTAGNVILNIIGIVASVVLGIIALVAIIFIAKDMIDYFKGKEPWHKPIPKVLVLILVGGLIYIIATNPFKLGQQGKGFGEKAIDVVEKTSNELLP